MAGTGSNAASDNAAATAAALRGASLAFGRQKKAEAEANSRQQIPSQQHQHLPPNPQRRHPSVSPSRESTVSMSTTQAANARLAATSAAASSSRDPSVSRPAGRAGSALLRPVSPSQRSTAARSNSSGESRSRSRGRNNTSITDFGSSPSSSTPMPALNRTRTGGGATNTAGSSLTVPLSTPVPLRHPRSTSFLAATRAASQAASPGITPSHTGQQGPGTISATSTGGPGPKPAYLSAALLASAASDEKRKAAAAAAAANLAAAESRINDDMARYGIRIGPRADEEDEYDDDEPDTTAIPATSSLVSMFEKSKNGGAKQRVGTRRSKTDDHSSGNSSPVRPPKPKAFTPPRSLSPVRREEAPAAKTPAKTPIKTPAKTPPLRAPTMPVTKEPTKTSPEPPVKPPTITASSNAPKKTDPVQEKATPKPQPEPQPKPKPKTEDTKPEPQQQQSKPIPIAKPKPQPATAQGSPASVDNIGKLERSSTGTSLPQHRISLQRLNDEDDVMARPTPPKPRVRESSAARARSRSLTKERDTPPRAASFNSRGPPPLAPPRRAASTLVAHPTGGSASPLRKPVATASSVDGLASAIMAGSLAAARHPSSVQSAASSMPGSRSRTPPAPPPRSSSPTKRTGMLTTLRRDRAHSDDDDYDLDGKSSGNTHYRRSHYHRDGRLRQGKHHLSHATPAALVGGGRHKHKHHEGSRRRWREAVTDRQRRRYEAVWASNRGRRGLVGMDNDDDRATLSTTTLDQNDDEDDTVPNVVVRDLWRRSRLPVDELAEVWDLVDETGTGRLGKAGFVVGLWLIDQRLRGRKIPARVSESVWSSARGIQGTSKQRRR